MSRLNVLETLADSWPYGVYNAGRLLEAWVEHNTRSIRVALRPVVLCPKDTNLAFSSNFGADSSSENGYVACLLGYSKLQPSLWDGDETS